MIQVYSKKGNKRRHPFVVYIDLGVCYLKGGKAKYLKEGSIHLEDGLVLDECDDLHLAAASGTKQRIDFVDFPYHLGPTPGRDKWRLISNDGRL